MSSEKPMAITATAEKVWEVIQCCTSQVCCSFPEIRMSLRMGQENIQILRVLHHF